MSFGKIHQNPADGQLIFPKNRTEKKYSKKIQNKNTLIK